MKDSSKNAIIIILIATIAVLSILLIQSQRVIEGQRVTIADQEKQINELKAENLKLSEVSPEKLMENAKEIIKEQGPSLLQSITEKAIQEVQER